VKPILVAALLLGACAPAPVEESVVPGTIGVAVRQQGKEVRITAVSNGNPLRIGDVVLRYNGAAVTSARQFYRLVVDSRPGSVARVEVAREGGARVIDVPVVELDTVPRV
jgi:S1-C subfamily serine protease